MRILIIGGGRFLGRAFAAEALAAGHQVTVFNRGRTSVDLDGVRVVHGDRENPQDLATLVASAPEAGQDGGPAWDAVIDTCDIALFGLRCIENGSYGAFPTTGPGTETFADMLEAGIRETGSGATLRWADDAFLLAHKVDEWIGLPLWAAEGGGSPAVWDVRSDLALAAGLVTRPIAETVCDTWAWQKDAEGLTDEDGKINGHGIAPEAEAAVLKDLLPA